jgi:spermidine synthase
MGLEIVGSRILAPTFGNSIFVWGSLISVVLAALSLGYWLGGKAADRWPRGAVLALFIAVPGVMVGLMPLYYRELNWWIAGGAFGARMGPLVSSVVLFLVPSVFLGTVSPFAVRLQARAVASVGKTAGGLYAVSTGGSIAGTMATSFWLISVLGVSRIVYVLGVVLVAVAAVVFFGDRRLRLGVLTLGCAALLAGAIALHARTVEPKTGVVLEKDTFYNHITVADGGGRRSLTFDNTYQSEMLLEDPWKLELRYTQTMALALALRQDPSKAPGRVLNIGLGGGSFPKRLYLDYPETVIDAVDIDPDVVAVAKKYFHVPEDDRFRLHAVDGRRFIRENEQSYDVVVLDAYNADTIPFHLTTREFYREVASRIAPGGVVVSNIIGIIQGNGSVYFRAMYRTLTDTFPVVYVFPVFEWSGETIADELNVIVVAALEGSGPNGSPLSRAELIDRVRRLGGRLVPPEELSKYASLLIEAPGGSEGAPLLTDDYAPVETLLVGIE